MAMFYPDLQAVFGALADPTRLAVVQRLADGPATVSELAAPFDMAGPSFLKHLKVLEGAGLVRSAKKGRVRTVELDPATLAWAEEWLARHRRLWQGRLEALGDFLEKDSDR